MIYTYIRTIKRSITIANIFMGAKYGPNPKKPTQNVKNTVPQITQNQKSGSRSRIHYTGDSSNLTRTGVSSSLI